MNRSKPILPTISFPKVCHPIVNSIWHRERVPGHRRFHCCVVSSLPLPATMEIIRHKVDPVEIFMKLRDLSFQIHSNNNNNNNNKYSLLAFHWLAILC